MRQAPAMSGQGVPRKQDGLQAGEGASRTPVRRRLVETLVAIRTGHPRCLDPLAECHPSGRHPDAAAMGNQARACCVGAGWSTGYLRGCRHRSPPASGSAPRTPLSVAPHVSVPGRIVSVPFRPDDSPARFSVSCGGRPSVPSSTVPRCRWMRRFEGGSRGRFLPPAPLASPSASPP